MPKTKLSAAQYQSLKKFLHHFGERFFNKPNEDIASKLLVVLDEMEKKAPGRAADALMLMINDCIEMSIGWRSEKVAAIDHEMRSEGAITLTELRQQYSRHYARILKRGRINTEEEYYLLKGVRDGATTSIAEEEMTGLDDLLDAYENKIAAQN